LAYSGSFPKVISTIEAASKNHSRGTLIAWKNASKGSKVSGNLYFFSTIFRSQTPRFPMNKRETSERSCDQPGSF
jgi:hypothetical protein